MTRELLRKAWFCVALVAGGSYAVAAEPVTESQQVQTDVEALLRATYAGAVDTVISYTHPTIVEMMGGKEAAHLATAQALQAVAQSGLKLESLSFPSTPEFLEGGGREFAIVPTLSVISTANGQKIESLNFQFGVREQASPKWHYIEGSRMNQEIAQALFPGFPPQYVFPETYRRKL